MKDTRNRENNDKNIANNINGFNSQIEDSGGKLLFGNNELASQFLNDYVSLPYLGEVQPEDLEDVSSQFVHMFSEERNADRVKKVSVPGKKPFFLIALIEHKSFIDYNLSMQILRYMVFIWEYYEKEAERERKGITHTKEFRYPPILPIVYYEGTKTWTVSEHFLSRIDQGEMFEGYLPDFSYYLVPVNQYSFKELLDKKDEISVAMLFNKLKTRDDINQFLQISTEQLQDILKDSSYEITNILAEILMAFLMKTNVSAEQAEGIAQKVRAKEMSALFADMEPIDVIGPWKEINRQREILEQDRKQFEEEKENLKEEKENLKEEKENLKEEKENLKEEKENLKEERRILEETLTSNQAEIARLKAILADNNIEQ